MQAGQVDPIRILEYQRAILAFSRTASEDLPLDRLVQHLCAQVSFVTDINKTKILQYRPEYPDLLVIAGVGWKPGVVGNATLPVDSTSPPGRSVLTAAPVIVEDLRSSTDFRWSPLLREHAVVCVANVPIMIDGRNWGVLEVDLSEPRQLGEAEINFLTICANMLGTAISRFGIRKKLIHAMEERARAKELWEISLRELQHRMKNNLQTIAAFLSLHRKNATTEDSRGRFGQVLGRVQAIALAQDQLVFSSSASEVNFGDYLRSLCANIPILSPRVNVVVSADKAPTVPLDKAVAAGLIVNELVTNSSKYAFEEDQAGVIQVRFSFSEQAEQVCLSVEDNGRGMEQAPKEGLGLHLVDALVAQLTGKLIRPEVPQGTRIDVYFPLPTSGKSSDEAADRPNPESGA